MTNKSADERRLREFDAVRAALEAAGLPSDDFGRFAGIGHPGVIRPSVFDYRNAVPVLLALMPEVSHPDVLESIVRSLSTSHARPVAVFPLVALFRATATEPNPTLKWAIGNALSVVATPAHKAVLLELALDANHGSGRQMIVDRLGRISGDLHIIDALRRLSTGPEVALHAQAGLRRQLSHSEAVEFIRPLLGHAAEGVRRGAIYNLKKADQALRRRARLQA